MWSTYKDWSYDRMSELLSVVIENYIIKWEPIWSKFLHSLEKLDYAPSTIRKYLNHLEQSWFVHQPYYSSWRIPTLDWIAIYLNTYINDPSQNDEEDVSLDVSQARYSLRSIFECNWKVYDLVVVLFFRYDE